MDVAGSIVVVSGASSGIGAAVARSVAERGAHAVLLARSRDPMQRSVDRLRADGHQATAFACDLTDLAAVAGTAERVRAAVGEPDVVVNNAGAGRYLSVEETDPAEARDMAMLPYVGAFALTRAFVPGMLARRRGVIVNVTSPAALVPFPGAVAYSVARGAMAHFTDALRMDLRGTGVTASLALIWEVESTYWAANPGARDRVPKIARIIPTLSEEEAASGVLRAIETERRVVSVPRALSGIRAAHAVLPGVLRGLVAATGYHRPGARRS